MFSLLTGKYRNIVIAIALFIVLDASILAMNFYIAFALKGDAIAVSQAGQLQMMSQRLMKSLYELEVSLRDNGDVNKPFKELKNTYQNFDETLAAFRQGGNTYSPTGEIVFLKAVETAQGEAFINKIDQVWQPFKNLINPVINLPAPVKQAWFLDNLAEAEMYVASNNITLLEISSDLANYMEVLASSKADRLRMVQTIGISLAIINFIIIIYHFIGQLRETDDQIHSVRGETRKILDTVNEGLFLLDRDLRISTEHSLFATKLFDDSDIANKRFEELFNNKVSNDDLAMIRKYLQVLLDGQVDESLLDDLNPLKNIRLLIANEKGQFENKYVSFSFKRAYEGDQVKQILVTAQDISIQVDLKAKLDKLQSSQGNHMSVLSRVLDHSPKDFVNFVNDSLARLHKINAILQQPSRRSDQFRQQIDHIATELHKLKGESSMMNMHSIAKDTHTMEESVIALRKKDDVEGDDFLPLAVMLRGLLEELEGYVKVAEQLQNLVEKYSQEEDKANGIVSKSALLSLIDGIASKHNKKVNLKLKQRGKDYLPESMLRPVKDILVQLVRNSVTHGIEPISMRGEKPAEGELSIQLIADAKQLTMTVRDDGNGIDLDKIRARVVEMQKASYTEVVSWSSAQLLKMIFEPGFSTASEVNEDAGRGLGMLAVRQMVHKLGGKISVKNEQGEFCKFILLLPITVDKKAIVNTENSV
ncbi:MAG: type IV pili methyl-accepting chemotaxis transducer N-terminal domain-containing protein [Pseudomonadales bacterium]|nr:type IV pili methyl-accepting chemotaxis transducer N-terminal domain-containing protein [Pseudomonadales bacterium]